MREDARAALWHQQSLFIAVTLSLFVYVTHLEKRS